MKAVVAAFNQEKALVGAFSVIVQLYRLIDLRHYNEVMPRFLDMHMYVTSALQRTDMKAVGLQLALDLLHEKVQMRVLCYYRYVLGVWPWFRVRHPSHRTRHKCEPSM